MSYHHCEDLEPDDGSDWKTLSTSEHTARKGHGCENCEGLIAPGQRYKKIAALDDGEFKIIRSHADRSECIAAGKAREEMEQKEAEWRALEWGRAWVVEQEENERWDAHMDDLLLLTWEHAVYS